jgi:hypothetical protein
MGCPHLIDNGFAEAGYDAVIASQGFICVLVPRVCQQGPAAQRMDFLLGGHDDDIILSDMLQDQRTYLLISNMNVRKTRNPEHEACPQKHNRGRILRKTGFWKNV